MKQLLVVNLFILMLTMGFSAQASNSVACDFETSGHKLVKISVDDGADGGIQIGLVTIDSELNIVSDQIDQIKISETESLKSLINEFRSLISLKQSHRIASVKVTTIGQGDAVISEFYDQTEKLITRTAKVSQLIGICQ